MKTLISVRSVIAASLVATLLSTGCANNSETKVTVISPTNSPAAAEAVMAEPIQQVPPTLPQFSPGIAELVRLAQANVEESVVLAYVETSTIPFEPTADEIVYLNDVGVSPTVVSAMIERGRKLRANPPPASGPAVLSTVIAFTNDTANPLAPQVLLTNDTLAAEVGPAVAPVTLPPPLATAQPTAPPATANGFYEPLAPYGTWMQVPDYGWVWQPSVAVLNPNWQPYWDGGRWVYSDAGWYWISDYSWGWAPFHYGRWYCHSTRGWLWVPDTVWGPSWVCWRRTPLYCGWAPLPPAAIYSYDYGFSYYGMSVGPDCDFGLGIASFSFVHYQYFCDPHPRRHWIHGRDAHSIYHESTVRNRYFVGPNHAIINAGIDRDHVAKFTRSEPRKISIRELPAGAGKYVKPDRIERQGSSLVVYRPQIQRGAPPSVMTPLKSASARPANGNGSTPNGRVHSGDRGGSSVAITERPTGGVQAPRPASPPSLGHGRAVGYPSSRLAQPSAPSTPAATASTPQGRSVSVTPAPAGRTLNRLEAERPTVSPYRPRFSVSNPQGNPGSSTTSANALYERSVNSPPPARSPATLPSATSRPTYTRQEPRSYSAPASSGSSWPANNAASSTRTIAPANTYRPSAPSMPLSVAPARSVGGGSRYSPPAVSTPAPSRSFSSPPSYSSPSFSAPAPSRPSGGGMSAPIPRAAAPSISAQPSGGSRSEPARAATSTSGSDPRRNNR